MIHPAFENHRFLVAEDEPLLAIELSQMLQQEGAAVFLANTLPKAMTFTDLPALSAGVVDLRLGNDSADTVCDELCRRGVPIVLYTGDPESHRYRWLGAPIIEKPATPEKIFGAIKYAVLADIRDVPAALREVHDIKVSADQSIVAAQERIERVKGLIARLRATGFDTSVTDQLLRTMIQTLDLMRNHRRRLDEQWKAPSKRSRS